MPRVKGLDGSSLRVPSSASTLAGFRAWATSGNVPDRGRISFIDKTIVIESGPEEFETHGKVKTAVASRLFLLAQELGMGTFYGGGTLVSNVKAKLSTEPDGTFVSWESLRSGKVKLVQCKGRPGEYVELSGTPDWVMEVVSRSSREKDIRRLRQAYHKAGIKEYWLIDALGEKLKFLILQRRPDGYAAVPPSQDPSGEWHRSLTFRRSFRLERSRDRLGYWQYTLQACEMRPHGQLS